MGKESGGVVGWDRERRGSGIPPGESKSKTDQTSFDEENADGEQQDGAVDETMIIVRSHHQSCESPEMAGQD